MERPSPSPWRDASVWLRVAAVALAYYGLARLGLLFAIPGSLASPIWPPTGLAIAAVALWRVPAAVGVFLGAAGAEYAASGNPAALLLALGSTAEALVGGLLLARLGGPAVFRTVAGVGRFVGIAVLAPAASALVAIAVLVGTGIVAPAAAPVVAWTWYLGDVAGAIVIAPALLLAAHARWSLPALRKSAEPIALTALVLGLAAALFGLVPGVPGNWPGRLLLLMPPLVWVAVRRSQAFAALLLAAVDALAVAATRAGLGPFPVSGPNTSFLQLQSFVLTAAIIVLFLGAVHAERRRAAEGLEGLVADRTARLSAEVAERRRAEAALKSAQAIAHVGSWEWDLPADRFAWSDELERILGAPPGTPASFAAYLAAVHPEDRAATEAALRQALADRKPFDFRHRVLRADGGVRTVHCQGRVEAGPAGRVRVSGTAHDVTVWQAQQERFAALLESAPDAMVIVDAEGRIVFVNGQVERLFGYARAELLGAGVEVLIPDRLRERHVEHREGFAAHPRTRAMGAGLDLRGRRKDGSEFPVEVSLSPLKTDDGTLVSSAIRDVTERRKAEAALRESLERFKVLADGSPLGIFHTTVQGQVDYANARWSEIAGCDYRDFNAIRAAVHPEDVERLTKAWRTAVANGSDLLAEFRYVHRDGKVVQCTTRASPVRDDSGAVTGFVGTLDDVTERRTLEAREREMDRLKEQARFKTEFLRTAAHELGNPLTPIKIQLRMLREFVRNGAHAEARKNVEILDRNVERLHLLVRDMLESARLQSGRLRLLPRPMDLSSLAHDVAETFQEAAIEAGVALEVEAPPALPLVADPDRLAQVLYNLLSNAMKFTPSGGRVHLEVRRSGGDGRALVTVTDTGAGFTAQQAAGLFQPFGQVHDAVPGKGGTGLGLYISKGIVEQHGGALEASSPGPGQGATFSMWVPLVADIRPDLERANDATPGKLFSS